MRPTPTALPFVRPVKCFRRCARWGSFGPSLTEADARMAHTQSGPCVDETLQATVVRAAGLRCVDPRS
jgi:hypothetical protein